MTAQLVPTYTDTTHYSEQVTLDGSPYVLTFDFNQREAAWYVSVGLPDGTRIYDGLKLVCNWPLMHKCSDPNRPPGDLFVLSNSADNSTPGLADLGTGGRCALYYLPQADLP